MVNVPDPHGEFAAHVNLWGSICTIVVFVFGGREFVLNLMAPSAGSLLTGTPRLFTILFLGLLAAVCHGVAWSLAELWFGWSFGAGGGDALPEGASAVVLSLTMTLSLVLVPPVYQKLAETSVVLPRHYFAAVAVIVLSAFGHLVMYGSRAIGFSGIRNIISPLGAPAHLSRAIFMELIYCVMHFGLIVLPYRVIVWSQFGSLDASVLWSTALAAIVWFFGINIFILLRYPGSLTDKTWIQVRGVIAGLLLVITLDGGMLM